jgi:DNA-binding Xre family transcriptional regulator
MPEESDVDREVSAWTAAVRAVLRREREQREWALDDLAARIDGITAQRLEALENGSAETRFTDLLQICWALGLDPAAVVEEASGGTGG